MVVVGCSRACCLRSPSNRRQRGGLPVAGLAAGEKPPRQSHCVTDFYEFRDDLGTRVELNPY